MKLRLQANSVRFRLKQREVAQLIKAGTIEEAVVFGPKPDDAFQYMLELSDAISEPRAERVKSGLLVRVPTETARSWANGNDVGIETDVAIDGQPNLRILIEKDFACLNGPEEQNVDTYPNPLAGAKC